MEGLLCAGRCATLFECSVFPSLGREVSDEETETRQRVALTASTPAPPGPLSDSSQRQAPWGQASGLAPKLCAMGSSRSCASSEPLVAQVLPNSSPPPAVASWRRFQKPPEAQGQRRRGKGHTW